MALLTPPLHVTLPNSPRSRLAWVADETPLRARRGATVERPTSTACPARERPIALQQKEAALDPNPLSERRLRRDRPRCGARLRSPGSRACRRSRARTGSSHCCHQTPAPDERSQASRSQAYRPNVARRSAAPTRKAPARVVPERVELTRSSGRSTLQLTLGHRSPGRNFSRLPTQGEFVGRAHSLP